jgi:hypothetical protein
MRAVVVTEPGKLELNYMWLPTFIGMSNRMKMELEQKLAPELVGKELTEGMLDLAHERVVDFILEKFPLPGLRDYLDAIKFVQG